MKRWILAFILCLIPAVAFAFTWNGRTISKWNGTTISNWNGVSVSGGSPAFTYSTKNAAYADSVQVTGVPSGSLVMIHLSWFEGTGDATVSDTGNAFTYANSVIGSAYCRSRLAYKLSSDKSGTVTYTGTWPSGSSAHCVHVIIYTYTGSISVDRINNGNTSSASTGVSADTTTTGTTELCFAGLTSAYSTNPSGMLIGSASPDTNANQSIDDGGESSASWAAQTTLSTQHAAATIDWGEYTCDLITFKVQ